MAPGKVINLNAKKPIDLLQSDPKWSVFIIILVVLFCISKAYCKNEPRSNLELHVLLDFSLSSWDEDDMGIESWAITEQVIDALIVGDEIKFYFFANVSSPFPTLKFIINRENDKSIIKEQLHSTLVKNQNGVSERFDRDVTDINVAINSLRTNFQEERLATLQNIAEPQNSKVVLLLSDGLHDPSGIYNAPDKRFETKKLTSFDQIGRAFHRLGKHNKDLLIFMIPFPFHMKEDKSFRFAHKKSWLSILGKTYMPAKEIEDIPRVIAEAFHIMRTHIVRHVKVQITGFYATVSKKIRVDLKILPVSFKTSSVFAEVFLDYIIVEENGECKKISVSENINEDGEIDGAKKTISIKSNQQFLGSRTFSLPSKVKRRYRENRIKNVGVKARLSQQYSELIKISVVNSIKNTCN